MLGRKMLRDVWKNKVPFLAIFLMMFAGNFIFSGITSEYNGMEQNFQSYVKETNLADFWVIGEAFENSEVSKLEKLSNVYDIEKRMSVTCSLSDSEKKTLDLFVIYSTNHISQIKVIKGKEYSNNQKGIWLDATFAKENGYKINDILELKVGQEKIRGRILGLCYSPEYIYNTTDGKLVPDHKNNGFVYINEKLLSKKISVQWNQLLLDGDKVSKKEIEETLGGKDVVIIGQNEHQSYTMLDDEIVQHKEIGSIFVSVFLLIAILITITTVHRLLNSQRMQIGILKALGFKKRRLYIHYISHSAFVCLVGSLSGWISGYFVLPAIILPIMEEMYIVPVFESEILKGSWSLPIICSVLCLTISAVVCKNYLKENAAQILYSNAVEKKYKRVPLSSFWNHLSFYVQWNMRDVFRNKLRSIMTIFGVVGCVSLLFASMGVYTSMNYMPRWAFGMVQTYNIKINGEFIDHEHKKELLEATYGEELMETSVELKYEDQSDTVTFTGLESQNFIRLYDEKDKQIELESGIAISKNVADEMGIRAGDRIKWKFVGQEEWYMDLVKYIIRTPMAQGITMMKEEMDKKEIPFISTSIIGEEPENYEIQSEKVESVQDKKDLVAGLDTILNASVMICFIFLVAAILLGSVILYNLGTLSYMERYRDMATLKVLGFNNKSVQHLMVQQNIWLTMTGIFIGIPVGYILLASMISTVQSTIDMKVYTPPVVFIISIIGTFCLSWIINKILSMKVCKIDMVAALKASE